MLFSLHGEERCSFKETAISKGNKMLHLQKQKAKQYIAKYGVFGLFHKYTCLQPNYGKNTKKVI